MLSSKCRCLQQEGIFGIRRAEGGAEEETGNGRCARGGRGGRGRRMFEGGALRFVVLKLIGEQPRHGYEIIKAIEGKSGGGYVPSPGMIYPMLSWLQDVGHVCVSSEGHRKLYAITPQGDAFLRENRAFADAVEARMSSSGPGCEGAARRGLQAIKEALDARMRGESLSEAQIKEIQAILSRAAREIREL
ncbi:MAG: PadR family transcriptional regulator [Betaproteobacteria bacterium]|nr:PadR family transcriptional regulator [Betaproteobacteria bacterium]